MSSNSYDKNTGLLSIIAGIPRTLINNIQAKADASINNQAKDIEPGNTATSAHSKGDYIIYGSSKKFAEVLSNISVGDSLSNATGGNIKDITQGEVLTELNSNLSNNLVSDLVITVTTSEPFSTSSTDGGSWSMTVTKSGYTPVFFTIGNTWGNVVSISLEGASLSNGKAAFSGAHYGRASQSGITVRAWVWWKKN